MNLSDFKDTKYLKLNYSKKQLIIFYKDKKIVCDERSSFYMQCYSNNLVVNKEICLNKTITKQLIKRLTFLREELYGDVFKLIFE